MKPKVIGWIQGRNGVFDVIDITIQTVNQVEPRVHFGAIGKRACEINGGFSVNEPVAINAMIDFLRSKGYRVSPSLRKMQLRPDLEGLPRSIRLAIGGE